jgi:hypothetical protein
MKCQNPGWNKAETAYKEKKIEKDYRNKMDYFDCNVYGNSRDLFWFRA